MWYSFEWEEKKIVLLRRVIVIEDKKEGEEAIKFGWIEG